MIDTKVRILDAAEHMFAEHGLDVSLRTITAEAGVNLAAINYHFQSKDALIDAVIARRIEPINAERVRLLNELEQQSTGEPLPLEGVIRAFVGPVFSIPKGAHTHVLIGRLFNMPDEFLKRVFSRHLGHIVERFSAAFARAMPGLPVDRIAWCMLLTVGAMLHVLGWSRLLPFLSHGAVGETSPETTIDRIVEFAAAGFRAALQNEANNEQVKHA